MMLSVNFCVDMTSRVKRQVGGRRDRADSRARGESLDEDALIGFLISQYEKPLMS